jgi:hypothetical protein
MGNITQMTREELFSLHTNLCEEAKQLLIAKNHDYAAETDIFRNFRLFGTLGILVRLSDKIARLRTFEETKSFVVKDESVKDTIMDIINYAVLMQGYLKEGEK